MNNSLAAVVITYNRMNFLKEVIKSLRNQTKKIDKIIVVNNGSTDGTTQWLVEQKDLLVINQDNVGSSGGQYIGFKTAYEEGFEWIWTMDDDVIPEDNCLENLFENINPFRIHTPLRFDKNGNPFYNDVKHFNLTNPFISIWRGVIDKEDLKQDYISAEGITFEGPLFHKSLIEKIGLPEKKFFIYGDDTEYFARATKAGFKIFVVKKAKSQRKLHYIDPDKKFNWKHYYIIRNIIAIDVLHGNLAVRIIRPWAYFIKWLGKVRSFDDLTTTLKAFKDGYFYKSEN